MSQAPPTLQPQKRRGCFFYGCLSLVILSLVVVALLVVATIQAPKLLNRWALQYTDATPVKLERVELPPAELRPLQERVARFQQALEDGRRVEELALTAHEINALIAADPAFKEVRDKLFVIISNDTIRGQVSWPLPDLGPFKFQGRYLNGEVALRVSLENGRLGVFLTDIKVKGQTLPGLLVGKFQEHNLAEEFQKDPQSAAQLGKFESIRVEDGKLILRNRAKP